MSLDPVAFDNEHEAFRESFGRFLEKTVLPDYNKWRESGAIPRSVYRAAGEFGFLGICAPEEYGGGGVTDPRFGAVLVQEAMRVGCTGFAVTLAWHSNVCIPFITAHASTEQKAEWLPALAAGEKLIMPVDGSCLQVSRSPDGDAVVTGAVGSVIGGAVADLLLTVITEDGRNTTLVADIEPSDHGDNPGAAFSVEPVVGSLGLEDAALADVVFGHRMSQSNLVAGDAGSEIAADGDLWLAVVHLAGAHAAFDRTVTYVQERKVFGERLSTFENTRFRLDAVSSRYSAVRAAVFAAIRQRQARVPSNADASALLRLAAGLHQDSVDLGLQLHGGYGYMREYPIAQAFADAGFLLASGGSNTEIYQVISPMARY